MYISVIGLLLGVALLVVGYGKGRQRPRKSGYIIAGWIVLGIQVIPLTIIMIGCLSINVNWVEYKPTSWLFPEVESSGWVWPPEDYQELVSRLEAEDLSAEEMDRLAKAAVAKYLQKDKRIFPVEIRALNKLRKLDKLTPEQQDQFFDRLVDLEMQAKTLVSANEGVPLRIDIMPQGDWSGCGIWCAVYITTESSLDEQAAPRIRVGRSSYMHANAIGAHLSPASSVPLVLQGPTFVVWQAKADVENIGKQNVTCDVKIEYFDKKPTGESASQPIHTIMKQLSVTSEVVADQSTMAAKLVTDPKLSPEVRGPDSGGYSGSPLRWQIGCYLFDVISGQNRKLLKMSVYIDDAHVGCAFNVTIELGSMMHSVGTICHRKDESLQWILTAPYPKTEPEVVMLTLTPNLELASESTDLPEIWGKAIEIKNIPRNRPVVLKPLGIE
ncbi:MAG: hypothetical protein ACYTBZ_16420 [Planctomycetota bacterium]|jgi:hypothetical protein